MLARISRGLAHQKAGRVKYRFDVVVEKLDNLPGPVKKCRVVWSRGPKLQMTDIKDVQKGAVVFKQKLSQIATMYEDAKGGFEPKEYKFQVQVPGKEDNKLLTVGRAELDMSHYVLADGAPQTKMIPMMFKVGMASTGYLKVTITAEVVASGGDSDDGMTEVSGMTGMTANMGVLFLDEQDLSGFGDEERSAQANSGMPGGANSRPSSRVSGAGTSPAKPDVKPAASTASSSSPVPGRGKASAKAAATKGDEDDEVSPMSLSPSSSGGASPRESSKPTRAAGKPSVVNKTAAADAGAQLFNPAPSKPSNKVAASPSGSSSRADPPLSEDEARAALFSATTSTSKPNSSQRASATPAGASSKPTTAAGKKDAAASSSPSASAEPSRPPSVAASDAASGSSTAAVSRRALLDRAAPQDNLQAAASTADTGPSSSKRQPPASQSPHGHSLSDSDEDSSHPQQAAQGRVQQAAAARAAQQQGAAAPFSRTKQQQPSQQPPPSTQQAAAAASSSAPAAGMASENEKLKAQLVALRQQAADAEEARRMAVLAADNAASERDEYRDRAQELQEQLKEALVGLISEEEAADLKQQLQSQQQQLQAQQQLHEAKLQAWQAERGTLQQQVTDAQLAAQKAQQAAEQHTQQLQQLQADADSHAGRMRHLSWQLEAAQHALQQQQQEQAAQPQPPSHAGADNADPPSTVPAHNAGATDQQWSTVLQFLADEVQTLSQHDLVHRCLTAELLQDAATAFAALEVNSAVQGPVLEVLGGLRAATAAMELQEVEKASQETSVEALTAALAQSQAANERLQQQCSSQASQAPGAAADMQALAAELAQLRDENARLAKQGLQQPGSPVVAAKPNTLPSGRSVLGGGLAAVPARDASCKVCVTVREQLSAAQHKSTKLTAARDKLEIILHDMEAAALEEQEQLQQQLAAANKALRSTGQQLTAAKQQLTRRQQELAGAQQQLAEAEARQAVDAQAAVAQPPQINTAAGEQQRQETAATAAKEAAPGVGAQAQVIALAENAGPSGVELALSAAQEQVADLQRQLAEADSVRRGLEKELARARKQLADEQCERSTLEEHMVTRLEDMGDDVAQETVAAYEAKYNRLKSRYRELTELHREEVDKLHDEIGTLQERVVELEALAAQLEAARSQAQHGDVTLADTLAKASKASSELTALRAENQMLTQNLISLKLELALCCEREVIGRHELYKSRETNLKLASKMTKLEVNVYANKK